jgi:hypothetical protein
MISIVAKQKLSSLAPENLQTFHRLQAYEQDHLQIGHTLIRLRFYLFPLTILSKFSMSGLNLCIDPRLPFLSVVFLCKADLTFADLSCVFYVLINYNGRRE